jgi:flagellar motility protein MotE (MotC chaperone)
MAVIVFWSLLPVAPAVRAKEEGPVKVTAQELSLSKSLRAREEAVEAREKELLMREQELAEMQKELDAKVEKLIGLQNEFKIQLDELKTVRDKRFRNLVNVYTAMSASKVAPLLDKMEDDEAVEILMAMKPDGVAKILPKMNKDKAVRLSKLLGLL